MEISRYAFGDAIDTGRCVLALGFFDGVHLGHRRLLLAARNLAKEMKLRFGVFTFDSDGPIKGGEDRIYGDEEKAELLGELGADFTVICDFKSVADLSPESFVSRVLVDGLSAEAAVAGFNYRFGKGASGDAAELVRLMNVHGKRALICDNYTHRGETVSATRIKAHLQRGEAAEAAELLGAPFRICGEVIHGNSAGRTLGFPTVNTARRGGLLLPRRGVYRTATVIDGRIYSALTNVGTCPTLGERQEHCETYILDFDGDLYGKKVTVYFIGFLRDEICFNSEKDLVTQINVDKNRIIKENGDVTWQELGLNLQ